MSLSPAFVRGALSFVAAGVVWEIVARYVVANPLFFSPLSAVFVAAVALWSSGELQQHMLTSFIEFAGGFLLACVLGILCGIAMASSRWLRDCFDPWVSMLYATPTIALGPLFILWMGIGLASKIAIIVLISMFPILINTMAGVRAADRTLIEVARSFGASSAQIYWKIRLPTALPFIIAGLRVSVARALVGVVVAELFGARDGLGFLIVASAQSFDTAGLFVGVLVLAVWGVLAVEFLKWLERWLAPWRFAQGED
jgi:NitT/TauT family transport system permease protein